MFLVFFFKQKTAYEMRISDWSSDVCSADLQTGARYEEAAGGSEPSETYRLGQEVFCLSQGAVEGGYSGVAGPFQRRRPIHRHQHSGQLVACIRDQYTYWLPDGFAGRSEEHTSELQSLMRISYAVFCLKKKTN